MRRYRARSVRPFTPGSATLQHSFLCWWRLSPSYAAGLQRS